MLALQGTEDFTSGAAFRVPSARQQVPCQAMREASLLKNSKHAHMPWCPEEIQCLQSCRPKHDGIYIHIIHTHACSHAPELLPSEDPKAPKPPPAAAALPRPPNPDPPKPAPNVEAELPRAEKGLVLALLGAVVEEGAEPEVPAEAGGAAVVAAAAPAVAVDGEEPAASGTAAACGGASALVVAGAEGAAAGE
eukprot:scaffold199870_cov19-Tisochrysis_lutea.AAC.1